VTDVSFIVPADNEEPLLADTLNAIRRTASASRYSSEIIVVDDASTDSTYLRYALRESREAFSKVGLLMDAVGEGSQRPTRIARMRSYALRIMAW
jgi:glycosyltransferase involved in cell wall biosynthesis